MRTPGFVDERHSIDGGMPSGEEMRRPKISEVVLGELGLQPASFGLRFWAALIDYLAVYILVFAAVALIYRITNPTNYPTQDRLSLSVLLTWTAVFPLYFWFFTGLKGQTLGTKLIGIRVVNREGGRPGWVRVLWRETLGRALMLSALCASLIFYALSSMAAYSYDATTANSYPDRGYRKSNDREPLDVLGFYDRLTGTYVVKKKARSA